MKDLLRSILGFSKRQPVGVGSAGLVVALLAARLGFDLSEAESAAIEAGIVAIGGFLMRRYVTPTVEAEKQSAVALALPQGTSSEVHEQVMKRESIKVATKPEDIPSVITPYPSAQSDPSRPHA